MPLAYITNVAYVHSICQEKFLLSVILYKFAEKFIMFNLRPPLNPLLGKEGTGDGTDLPQSSSW
jgi:hypothetical protein